MKIRIQDHSIRYRITLKELEIINQEKSCEAQTEIYDPQTAQCISRFHYGIKADPQAQESYCEIRDHSIFFYVCPADLKTLNDPSQEGIYLRKETILPDQTVHRFIAFIEKDRPPTKCDKPEEWIYETTADGKRMTRPIEQG